MIKKRLILAVFTPLIFIANPLAAASDVWVSVKQSAIRKAPSFFSPVIQPVSYHQKLSLVNDENSWWKVEIDSTEGWIHPSAVSRELVIKTDKPSSGKKDPFDIYNENTEVPEADKKTHNTEHELARHQHQLDDDEITLAGKGFNKYTEERYIKDNSKLNYDAVNLMENRTLESFSIEDFALAGGLQVSQKHSKPTAPEKSNADSVLEMFE